MEASQSRLCEPAESTNGREGCMDERSNFDWPYELANALPPRLLSPAGAREEYQASSLTFSPPRSERANAFAQGYEEPPAEYDADAMEIGPSEPSRAARKSSAPRLRRSVRPKDKAEDSPTEEEAYDEKAEQHEQDIASLAVRAPRGTATKERRRKQNRVAQRSLRLRKDAYLHDLEAQVVQQSEEIALVKAENEQLKQQNDELRRLVKEERARHGCDRASVHGNDHRSPRPQLNHNAQPYSSYLPPAGVYPHKSPPMWTQPLPAPLNASSFGASPPSRQVQPHMPALGGATSQTWSSKTGESSPNRRGSAPAFSSAYSDHMLFQQAPATHDASLQHTDAYDSYGRSTT